MCVSVPMYITISPTNGNALSYAQMWPKGKVADSKYVFFFFAFLIVFGGLEFATGLS